MNQPNRSAAFFALLGLLIWSAPTIAAINIRTEKGGKILLVVDDESVRTAPGAKPVLVIDGPNISTEKGGRLVFFIDGDILHAGKPEGPIAAYHDGRHVKSAPGGTELFYIDGALIRPDHDGAPLYYVDGEVMNNPQLMAVLYTLKPEKFNVPADSGAPAAPPVDQTASATPAPAPAAATPAANPGTPGKEFTGGTYTIASFTSSDNTKRQGKIIIKKQGDIYAMDLRYDGNDPLQGVAINQNGEIWAAVGPPATVGLAVYKIDGGNLTGTWYNVTGDSSKFGSENLIGAPTLGGAYNITAAKAPFTGAPYGGTVTLKAVDGTSLGGDAPVYHVAWNLGGYKAEGAAFKAADSLVAATSTGPEYYVVRFKFNPADGSLKADFYTDSRATGSYTLTRDGD